MLLRGRAASAVVIGALVCVLLAACGSSGGSSGSGSTTSGSQAVATSAAGCPTSNTTSFAKSKFLLHAGLALGTFHRYIYKPFRAGTFSKGAHGRITGLVKAGATALFDKREIRLAYQDAQANPTLCKAIAAPLSSLTSAFGTIGSNITHGGTSGITGAQSAASQLSSAAKSAGDTITERTDESSG